MTVEENSQAASILSVAAEKLNAELVEARGHQRAAAKVFKVTAEFPNETQSVFDAIANAAADLCGAAYCNIHLYDGKNPRWCHPQLPTL